MSIVIEPRDILKFPRPREDGTKKSITVKNPNNFMVSFKFKTTAPKHYCVRPNSGYVPPLGKIEVTVLFQVREDIPYDAKCKDKFLVLSLPCDNDEKDSAEFWTLAESTRKADTQEQKLVCEFIEEEEEEEELNLKQQSKPITNTITTEISSNISPNTTVKSSSTVNEVAAGRSPPPKISLPDPQRRSNDDSNRTTTTTTTSEMESTTNILKKSDEHFSLIKEINELKIQLEETSNKLKEMERNRKNSTTIITKKIINPDSYSIKVVLIASFVAFLIGVIIY